MSHWQKKKPGWAIPHLHGPAGGLCARHPFVVGGDKTRMVGVVYALISL